MKLLLLIAGLSFVGFNMCEPLTRPPPPLPTCRGEACVPSCEPGTHLYYTACGPLTPEATCGEPNPQAESGDVCDFMKCYCNAPTVRDPITNKCVPLDQCSKQDDNKQ